MRNAASFLFPALVAVSLGLHLWVLQKGVPRLAPPRKSQPVETTEIFLLEQQPPPAAREMDAPPQDVVPEPVPLPEPAVEPVPEPLPEPPAQPEPIQEAAEAPPPEPPKRHSPPEPVARSSKPRTSRTAHVPAPLVLNNPAPAYPELARQKGWEGRTIVRVEVSPAGHATKVSIARGSGFGVLDQAALRAVKKWRFQPRTVGGLPAPGVVEVPVNFSLDR
jgi:protein TonB